MDLYDALHLPPRGTLCLVGGGGKSTLLLRLAAACAGAGRRAVVTTTTQITRAQGEAAGVLLLAEGPGQLQSALAAHPVVCAAGPGKTPQKLGPPPPAVLAAAPNLADWVIAEADGARRLPVKAPAPYEPVLLPGALVTAVAGLSALGRPLDQVCHRADLAAALLGISPETVLTPDLLARLLTSPQGQYKGVRDPAGFRVLLNQADTVSRAEAAQTAAAIRDRLPGCRVVVAALAEETCIKEVF